MAARVARPSSLPANAPAAEPQRILEQVARQYEDHREHREAHQESEDQDLEVPVGEVDDRGDERHGEGEDGEEESAHLSRDEAPELAHVPRVPPDLQFLPL